MAVVHDWCPNFRGGERVLAQICKQFPNAEIFTLFDFLTAEVKEQYFRDVEFHTSAANRL
ncbi:glycosyltransferase family 4 protein, partial [Mesorhizobium sp. M1D.F.Ca.ET.183.01.1.1]